MLETLANRLQKIFQNLARRGALSEVEVDAALRDVRLALLEADVHFSVVKDFLARVRTRAVGSEVSHALNPAQQVIQIVHEELAVTLGPADTGRLSGPKPRVVLLAGLQGCGKTTTAAKLAYRLRNDGERVMLVAADTRRPAAVQQLQVLGEKIKAPVFTGEGDPVEICRRAVDLARRQGDSAVLLDTAGRQQLDEELMDELRRIVEAVQPVERLLVADAMTGQEAVRIAEGFHAAIGITGIILTKLDGDARGGAAISMRAVTGVPIRWTGTGEGVEALDVFDPRSMAGRILGMGDMLGLIRKATESLERDSTEKQAARMAAGELTLDDMIDQMRQMRRMGSLSSILEMLPGAGRSELSAEQQKEADQSMKRMEAILLSMTPEERREPDILNASRKRRIARGSGTEVQEVNQLLKRFREARRMVKNLSKGGGFSPLAGGGLGRFLR